jgi:prophage regulatory protein
MQDQFWRLERVKAETGLTTSAIYEMMAANTFPKNFPITARSVAWRQSEVEKWKADRLKAAGKLQEAA